MFLKNSIFCIYSAFWNKYYIWIWRC